MLHWEINTEEIKRRMNILSFIRYDNQGCFLINIWVPAPVFRHNSPPNYNQDHNEAGRYLIVGNQHPTKDLREFLKRTG